MCKLVGTGNSDVSGQTADKTLAQGITELFKKDWEIDGTALSQSLQPIVSGLT